MNSLIVSVQTGKLQLLKIWFILIGFLPVFTIVLHCLQIISMQNSLILLVLPALIISANISAYNLSVAKCVFNGWLAGIIAVTFYDISRLPFILYGWEDFIPKIGAWLTASENSSFILGYAWRYIGNGGGMGISFFILLKLLNVQKALIFYGILFGLFVFMCLLITLITFTEAQKIMFAITPLTFAGSLTGHIVYGYVLGIIATKWK